ncbi:MAG TPA: protein kinase, partial [Polyangia bacterium]|nr:protein kinase [Polyangia bacterium]
MFVAGDKIGAYVVKSRLGAGGMGEVYLAEHVHIGRKAAIKVLLPELASRPDVVARFFNEARATGLLRHPNIVEVLDCDVLATGHAYIVMELLGGESLSACLARVGNFAAAWPTALAIAGQIASALSAAHAR